MQRVARGHHGGAGPRGLPRALRVEDVAARAEVNKTTRLPPLAGREGAPSCTTRSGASPSKKLVQPPETGALRSDLLSIGRVMVELWSSPQGQSVVRMLVAEGS